jgi:hypothetical protein
MYPLAEEIKAIPEEILNEAWPLLPGNHPTDCKGEENQNGVEIPTDS